jgi:hypothetical protein
MKFFKRCDSEVCQVEQGGNLKYLLVMGDIKDWLTADQQHFYIPQRDIYGDVAIPYFHNKQRSFLVSMHDEWALFPLDEKRLERMREFQMLHQMTSRKVKQKKRHGVRKQRSMKRYRPFLVNRR